MSEKKQARARANLPYFHPIITKYRPLIKDIDSTFLEGRDIYEILEHLNSHGYEVLLGEYSECIPVMTAFSRAIALEYWTEFFQSSRIENSHSRIREGLILNQKVQYPLVGNSSYSQFKLWVREYFSGYGEEDFVKDAFYFAKFHHYRSTKTYKDMRLCDFIHAEWKHIGTRIKESCPIINTDCSNMFGGGGDYVRELFPTSIATVEGLHRQLARVYYMVEGAIRSKVIGETKYGVYAEDAKVAIMRYLPYTKNTMKRKLVLEMARCMCISYAVWLGLFSKEYRTLHYDPITGEYLGLNPLLFINGVINSLVITDDMVSHALDSLYFI